MGLVLLLDEHVPTTYSQYTERIDEQRWVDEEVGQGASDARIYDYACSEGLCIVTNDTDFLKYEYTDTQATLLYYPNQNLSASDFFTIVERVVSYVGDIDELDGQIVYVTKDWLD